MQTFAHIVGGAVREVLSIPLDLKLGVDLYAPDLAAECVPCDVSVVAGMLYDADTKAFAPAPPPPVDLAAHAKVRRIQALASGITVKGLAVDSAPDDEARVVSILTGMQESGATSVRFKASAGFIALDLDQVKAIRVALFAHTQACFAAEDAVDAGLAASPPTITTTAEVDAAFAAVPSAY